MRGKSAIFDHAEIEGQPVALAIFGDERNTMAHGISRIRTLRPRGRLCGSLRTVGGRRLRTAPCDVGPAAADKAEHPHDLAGANVKSDVVEDAGKRSVRDIPIRDRRPGLAARDRSRRASRPTMARIKPSLSRARRCRFHHPGAILQHQNRVGDLEHFLESMRNVDDHGSIRGQAPNRSEQELGLVQREHRRRLVQDQHLWFADQRLGDLDDLLHRDAKLRDPRADIDARKPRSARTPTPRFIGLAPNRSPSEGCGAASFRAACSRRH